MPDSTIGTVSIRLDVHARSIRLAALRADELLEERTLPYDPEALARLLLDDELARSLGAAGRKKAATRYSHERFRTALAVALAPPTGR